jgi:uncharacterized membrane protein YgdD (TMEM256/DUF423 family)
MVEAVLNVGLFAALVLFIVEFSTWAARGPAIWGSPRWLIRGILFSGAIELRRPRYDRPPGPQTVGATHRSFPPEHKQKPKR